MKNNSIKNNPQQPQTQIDEHLLHELVEYVITLGARSRKAKLVILDLGANWPDRHGVKHSALLTGGRGCRCGTRMEAFP